MPRAADLHHTREGGKRLFLSSPPVGQQFSRWTVLAPSERINSRLVSLCRCNCGTQRVVRVEALASGKSTSCGCHKNEQFEARRHDRSIHGMSGSTEHKLWMKVIRRCENQNDPSYRDYGARGIHVCDRWRNGEGGLSGFECFFADMGARPSVAHTLEREDNDGPYAPHNVVWATRTEQNRNTRRNRLVEFRGEVVAASVAIERWGAAPAKCIYKRLRMGWSPEQALLTPSGVAR